MGTKQPNPTRRHKETRPGERDASPTTADLLERAGRLTGADLEYGDVLRLDSETEEEKRGFTDRRTPLMSSTQQRQQTTSNRVNMQISLHLKS